MAAKIIKPHRPLEKALSPAPKSPAKQKKLTKARLISSKLAYKGHVFNVYSDTVQEPGGAINTPTSSATTAPSSSSPSTNRIPKPPSSSSSDSTATPPASSSSSFPPGRIEPGEAPLPAAKREMIEETGYRAQTLDPAHQILRQPRLPRRMDADLPRPRHPRRHRNSRAR